MKDPRMKDPGIKDPRMKDPRMKDPRMKDPRMKDTRMKDPGIKDPVHGLEFCQKFAAFPPPLFSEFLLNGLSRRVMKTEEGEAADLAEDGRQRGWFVGLIVV